MIEQLTTSETKEDNRAATFRGGEVNYSIEGEPNDQHNPVILVTSFSRGRKALQRLAKEVSNKGDRQVIDYDQPRTISGLNPLNNQARALLAILEDSGLAGRPVDFVAYSFGSLILTRAAKIAKRRGMDMTTFDSSKGSRSVFVAPSGSIARDGPFKLKGRLKEHVAQSVATGRRGLYPEVDEEATANLKRQPLKTLREGIALGRKRVRYNKLGKLGIKPTVLGYPKDLLFPAELTAPFITKHDKYIMGYAMPITPNGAHDDPIFNDQPTAAAILQILDANR